MTVLQDVLKIVQIVAVEAVMIVVALNVLGLVLDTAKGLVVVSVICIANQAVKQNVQVVVKQIVLIPVRISVRLDV